MTEQGKAPAARTASQAEMLVCLRHWYECNGCPLCQEVRDHYASEDAQHAELVKKIMVSEPAPEAPAIKIVAGPDVSWRDLFAAARRELEKESPPEIQPPPDSKG